MRYAETGILPFTSGAIEDDFVSVKPGQADPGDPGFWMIFKGDSVVFNAEAGVSLVA